MSKTTPNRQVSPSLDPLFGFAALSTTSCYITQSGLWVSWLELSDGDAPCPVLKTQLVGVDGLWSTPQIYSADALECTQATCGVLSRLGIQFDVCASRKSFYNTGQPFPNLVFMIMGTKNHVDIKIQWIASSATAWREIWAVTTKKLHLP